MPELPAAGVAHLIPLACVESAVSTCVLEPTPSRAGVLAPVATNKSPLVVSVALSSLAARSVTRLVTSPSTCPWPVADLPARPGTVGAAAVPDRSPASCTTPFAPAVRSEEHTSELQSLRHLVCRLLLEKKKN